MRESRQRARWLAFALALPPLLLLSHDIVGFGRIPNYTGFLSQIATPEGMSLNPVDYLFAKANEHTITLPAMLYAANVLVTHGDNRALSVVVLLELLLLFALLFSLVPKILTRDLATTVTCAGGLALFVFSPSLAELVVASFAGIIFVTASAVSVAAIVALRRCAPLGIVWPVVVLGLIGNLVHSASVMVWPTLLFGAVALDLRRRDLAILAAAGVASWSLVAALYQPVEGHPPPELSNPLKLFSYTGGYLAAPFTGDATRAWVIGWTGIAFWIGSMAAVNLSSSRSLAWSTIPWHMVQGFVVTNAAAAAVMRSALDGPFQPRFAVLPALFWLSFLPLGALLIRRARWQPNARYAARAVHLGVIAALCVPMYSRGLPLLEGMVENAAYDPLVGQAIVHEIHDDYVFRRLTAFPGEFWLLRPLWMALKHVPFDHPPSLATGRQIPAGSIAAPSPRVRGFFDVFQPVDAKFGRAGGWAYGFDDDVIEVVVADERGAILGTMVLGLRRNDLKEPIARGAVNAGWSGYVHLPEDKAHLTAYARTRTLASFFPLEKPWTSDAR